MTRRIQEAHELGVRLNETGLALLRDIDRRQDGEPHSVPVSLTELCQVLSRSAASARLACRALESEGLLKVCTRHLPNGGQLENEYALTDLGRDVLAHVDEANED